MIIDNTILTPMLDPNKSSLEVEEIEFEATPYNSPKVDELAEKLKSKYVIETKPLVEGEKYTIDALDTIIANKSLSTEIRVIAGILRSLANAREPKTYILSTNDNEEQTDDSTQNSDFICKVGDMIRNGILPECVIGEPQVTIQRGNEEPTEL